MKHRTHILSSMVVVLIAILLQSLVAAPRPSSKNRRSRTPVLKKGDKAPDFSLLLLSENATDKDRVTLSAAIKDRPVALVFSSFT